jgi:hypothetical protein
MPINRRMPLAVAGGCNSRTAATLSITGLMPSRKPPQYKREYDISVSTIVQYVRGTTVTQTVQTATVDERSFSRSAMAAQDLDFGPRLRVVI